MKKKGNSGLMLIALISMVVIVFSSCKKKGGDQDPEPMHTIDLSFQGYDSVQCTIVSSDRVNTQLPAGVSQVLTDSGYVWKQWVYDVSGINECRVKLNTKANTRIKLYGAFNEVPGGQIRMLFYYDGQFSNQFDFHTNFNVDLN